MPARRPPAAAARHCAASTSARTSVRQQGNQRRVPLLLSLAWTGRVGAMQPRSQCARDSLPQAEDKQEKHPGTGHRARLRERLLCGGAEELDDYEVLDYLRFAGIRQGDTKPLAKANLARFGSLAERKGFVEGKSVAFGVIPVL